MEEHSQNISLDISISNVIRAYQSSQNRPWSRHYPQHEYSTPNVYKLFMFDRGSAISTLNGVDYVHSRHSLTFTRETEKYVRNSGDLPLHGCSILFETDKPIEKLFDEHPILIAFPENHEKINKLFLKAFSLFTKTPPYWKISLKSIAYEIISEFLLSYNKVERLKSLPNYLKQSEEFIRENACFCPISIKDLAEEYHISVDHFRRSFEKYFGMTPRKYINEIKLSYAVSLLSSTDKSISEIALLSGFNNISNFNTLFKERFGTTPLKYRVENECGYL